MTDKRPQAIIVMIRVCQMGFHTNRGTQWQPTVNNGQ